AWQPRQLGDEFEALRTFVARNQGAAVRQKLFGRTTDAGLTDDDALDRLAPLRVRHTDHGRICNGWVGHERLLHLAAVDILAAADNEVLFPINEIDEAVFVLTGKVSSVQPSVAKRLDRRRGIVPVARHVLS